MPLAPTREPLSYWSLVATGKGKFQIHFRNQNHSYSTELIQCQPLSPPPSSLISRFPYLSLLVQKDQTRRHSRRSRRDWLSCLKFASLQLLLHFLGWSSSACCCLSVAELGLRDSGRSHLWFHSHRRSLRTGSQNAGPLFCLPCERSRKPAKRRPCRRTGLATSSGCRPLQRVPLPPSTIPIRYNCRPRWWAASLVSPP